MITMSANDEDATPDDGNVVLPHHDHDHEDHMDADATAFMLNESTIEAAAA
jgi:hypothetical protein